MLRGSCQKIGKLTLGKVLSMILNPSLNPDKRVELLKDYVFERFPKANLLHYALKVEKITTSKKENLILNVDGTIGASFIDMFWLLGYSDAEIDKLIKDGALNAFFVIGRTIGLIGHYLDEKRLEMPFYRHPVDDILYDIGNIAES